MPTRMLRLSPDDKHEVARILQTPSGGRGEVLWQRAVDMLDGHEVDVKIVESSDEDEFPWTEAVLLENGREVAVTDIGDDIIGTWDFEKGGIHYTVIVE